MGKKWKKRWGEKQKMKTDLCTEQEKKVTLRFVQLELQQY